MTISQGSNTFNGLKLSRMTQDRIRSANYYLTDFLTEALGSHRDFELTLRVSKKNLDSIRTNEAAYRDLMGTSFLVVTPTLTEVNDWKSLTDHTTSTLAIDKLRKDTPRLNGQDQIRLFYNNRQYLWMLVELLHTSVLAAPLLGISQELADYLRKVPQHVLDLGIAQVEFPIFRWRISSKLFWTEYQSDRVSPEALAHYFLASTPVRADRLEHKHSWSNLRLHRYQSKVYSEMLIRQHCRASTVGSLLAISPATSRRLYMEIHGVSSPSGKVPSSLNWYFEAPTYRQQATMMVSLYRMALATGANVPAAFIAAFDVMQSLFGSDLKLTADRACHICRAMASSAEVELAPCRICSTPYLIANTGPRIELSHNFACPSCSASLSHQTVAKRKRRDK